MRRLVRTVTVLALCAAGFACTQPPADTTEEARAGIATTNRAFMEAVTQGDAAAIAACYTEDGEILPPNGASVQGHEGIESTFAGMLATGVTSLTLATSEVEGRGDTAYEVGAYELHGGDDDQVLDVGKYIVVWKQVGEEWKLHRDIWNSDQPIPAAEPAAEPED